MVTRDDTKVSSSVNDGEFVDAFADARGTVWVLVPELDGDAYAYAMKFTAHEADRIANLLRFVAAEARMRRSDA